MTTKIRSRWLTVRLSDDEETRLRKLYAKTTCKAISEYARDVLLREPITVVYRNQSADQFLEEMILLRRELNAIGNNFNQAVHRLHTLDHDSQIKVWAMLNESNKKLFMAKVNEISEMMSRIYEVWLQK
jgi:hypothetical protein